MVKWRERWVLVAWAMLGFLMFLSGFVSGNVITMVVAAILLVGITSAYLTSYVKTEHKVKKALEVISILLSFAIAVHGYVITGSLVLGVITLFIAAMALFAFVVSYLLPKIRSNRVKT